MGELKTYVCDGCNAEYTGDATDAAKEGWRDHKYKKRARDRFFVLCGKCEERYTASWDFQAAYKEAWK